MDKQNINISGDVGGDVSVAGGDQKIKNEKSSNTPIYLRIIKAVVSWFNNKT